MTTAPEEEHGIGYRDPPPLQLIDPNCRSLLLVCTEFDSSHRHSLFASVELQLCLALMHSGVVGFDGVRWAEFQGCFDLKGWGVGVALMTRSQRSLPQSFRRAFILEIYLTQSVFKVVLQKSTPPRIR